MKHAALLAALAIVLIGCGGRPANPVQVRQSYDHWMTCTEIVDEMVLLQFQAKRLMREQGADEAENLATVGVGLVLFPPLLFGLDLEHAEEREARAKQARYKHLGEIFDLKDCPVGMFPHDSQY